MEIQHADWINWFSKCILEEAVVRYSSQLEDIA